MYNGLNKGDFQGNLLTQNHGLIDGQSNGMIGDNDNRSDYCLEAKTLFLAMTVQPDPVRKKIINKFITDLKLANIWSELDALWVMASHDRQASKLNFKNPSLYSLTEVNTPTFATDRGFTGNGTTQYLNTGFNIATNATKYLVANMSAGAYIRTNSNELKLDFGVADGTSYLWLISRNGSDQIQDRANNNNTNTVSTSTITDSRGLNVVSRTSSGKTYKNGIDVTSSAGTTSGAVPSGNAYILCYNNSGTPATFSTRQSALVFIGGANYNQATLYSIIQNYMTAIGAQV